ILMIGTREGCCLGPSTSLRKALAAAGRRPPSITTGGVVAWVTTRLVFCGCSGASLVLAIVVAPWSGDERERSLLGCEEIAAQVGQDVGPLHPGLPGHEASAFESADRESHRPIRVHAVLAAGLHVLEDLHLLVVQLDLRLGHSSSPSVSGWARVVFLLVDLAPLFEGARVRQDSRDVPGDGEVAVGA